MAKMHSLAHVDIPQQPFFGRELLITSSTAEVQAFIKKHQKSLFDTEVLQFRRPKKAVEKPNVKKAKANKDKNKKEYQDKTSAMSP